MNRNTLNRAEGLLKRGSFKEYLNGVTLVTENFEVKYMRVSFTKYFRGYSENMEILIRPDGRYKVRQSLSRNVQGHEYFFNDSTVSEVLTMVNASR